MPKLGELDNNPIDEIVGCYERTLRRRCAKNNRIVARSMGCELHINQAKLVIEQDDYIYTLVATVGRRTIHVLVTSKGWTKNFTRTYVRGKFGCVRKDALVLSTMIEHRVIREVMSS